MTSDQITGLLFLVLLLVAVFQVGTVVGGLEMAEMLDKGVNYGVYR